MRLLLDTDAFCKLGLTGLLPDSLAILGVRVGDCARLPALPYMLKKGRIPKTYGERACARLLPIAQKMGTVQCPDASWLDPLTAVNGIDPGEAQLFACAAQHELLVATGDKHALGELKALGSFTSALSGRIVVLEAMLLALCQRIGPSKVQEQILPIVSTDRTFSACFSRKGSDPTAALESHYRRLVSELRPLILWEPPRGGSK